jgi:asparagine synthase (glutamine-hydrolysing)
VCGICGKVYLDPTRYATAPEVLLMANTLTRRGPDAAGVHVDRHAGLGHRRLAVIDVEASKQPMSNADGTIWISYNGEIYNFAELRADLIARGHRFKTAGDTEVIVHLYEEFGPDCVRRMRGMFAFAIWDSRSDTLFLARDRIGIKPLYYMLTEEAFLFGSELKAIAVDESFQHYKQIDLTAVHAYLSFLCVPDPVSIYRGVFKLPAGHTLTLRNGRIQLDRYWDVNFEADYGPRPDEWRERLFEKLREAVRIRLVADVPLGAFLSGGIDSSTVVALMAHLMDQPVKTFSIGFTEQRYDEASDAKLVAKHLGTDHTELILTPSEALSVIPDVLANFDEPYADSSAIPTYYVSELARRHVTVALSGDGGDELFGGYPWRQVRPPYQRALSGLPYPARAGMRRIARFLPSGLPGSNFLRRVDIPYNRYILDAMAVFDEQDRAGLYSESATEQLGREDPYAYHLPHLSRLPHRPWTARMMEYDLKTYLPNDILTKVDRMSMMHSLEARVPLLDHELVELAAEIPPELKIRHGIGKQILKEVIAPLLPREVMTKKKQGFSIPLETWLRTDLKVEVLDTLRAGNRHGIFKQQALDEITDAFFRGDDGRNHQVWALYAFEHWYQYVHNRSVSCSQSAVCHT